MTPASSVAKASRWRHRAALCAGPRKLSQAEKLSPVHARLYREPAERPTGQVSRSLSMVNHRESLRNLEITAWNPKSQKCILKTNEIFTCFLKSVKSSEIRWNPVKSLTKSEITLEILKSFVYLEDFEISYASSPSGKPLGYSRTEGKERSKQHTFFAMTRPAHFMREKITT